MKNSGIIAFIIILIAAGGAWLMGRSDSGENEAAPNTPAQNEPSMEDNQAKTLVVLHTNKGDITIELFMDKTPITAGNFAKLAREGFYDNTKFHRVISGFMIQGGDPGSKGDDPSLYGRGGPGYNIQDEFVGELSNVRGTISMANTGQPNSGGSQFFINLVDNTGLDFDKPPLTSSHAVFGRVTEGMDVVDAIAETPKDARDVPLEPVIITSISLSD